MKTRILSILWCVILLCSTQINAQNFNFAWANGMGSSSNDAPIGIKIDASGNTYTTGLFSGTVDFDPGVGILNLTSNGGEDGFITKTSPTGALLWARQIGGAGQDRAYTSALNSAGDVYFTGFFNFTVDFDPTAGIFNLSSNGDRDFFIVKLTTNGAFTWAKTMGGSFVDMGLGIAVDNLDNVIVSGTFQDVTDFDPNAGTTFLASNGDYDAFVVKLNSSGVFQWAINMGGANFDSAISVTVDANRDIYATGVFQSTADFDPSAATFNLTTIAGNDVFINKINANGTFNFVKQIGSIANDGVNIITVDNASNIYTTGFFQGTADLDPNAGTSNVTSAGDDDIFVSKLDINGNFVWGKQLGGSLTDRSTAIAVDASSNVYVGGNFSGTADFNPSIAVSNLTSAGLGDGFVCKLTGAGNFVYAKSFGATAGDGIQSIGVDTGGSVYVAGFFNNTVDFNLDAGVSNLTSAGGNDIFIAKYTQCGITFNNLTATNASVGLGYTLDASATVPSGTLVYTVSPTLPAGLGINSSTGSISGTPTTATISTTYTVTATQGTCSNTQIYTFAVGSTCPTITINPASLPAGVVGNFYSQTVTQTGLAGTPTWSISAGALPNGVSITSTTGAISGTLTNAGSFNFTVSVTDGTCTQTKAYTVVITCPSITFTNTTSSVGAEVGTAFTFNASATGNTQPITYSVSPALPLGLSLNATTGLISGTPTTATSGFLNCTITVTQGTCTTTRVLSFFVTCPIITFVIPIFSNPIVGTPFTMNTSVFGNTQPVTYSVLPALPAGLTLNTTTGILSGTPTAQATSTTYVVTATQGTCSTTAGRVFAVVCPTLTFTSAAVTNGTVGVAYTLDGSLTSSVGVVYSVSPTLPAGLSINTSTGIISGTPTTATTSATYTVTAAQGTCTATRGYAFSVACPVITFNSTTASNGVVGTSYFLNASVTGNNLAVVYSISPALPAGLSINTTNGNISGVPTSPAISTTYTVTVAQGTCSVTQNYTFAITCPTLVFTNLTATTATVGTPYTLNAGVTGSTGTLVYSVSPALPAGLSLNTTTGTISGTPTVPAALNTYTVTAAQGTCTVTRAYTFLVACAGISINPASLPNGTIGTAYNQTVTQTGLASTPTWSLSTGSVLPAGLSLASGTGVISGTPTAVGTSTFTINVTDGSCTQTRTYTVVTACPTITFTNTTANIAIINTPYTLNAGVTGNTATVTYSISPTSLPAGLSFNTATGLISGTPTAITPSATYTVTADQSAGVCVRTQTYTFAVTNCLPFAIAPNTNFLPNGNVGVPYLGVTFTAVNAPVGATYMFAQVSGVSLTTLGLSLNTATGTISGTPTFSSSINIVIVATNNATGCPSTPTSYTLVVYPNPATSIDNSLDNQVKVSPNPSSNDFNVDFGNINMAKSLVRVYDAQGKVVYSSENNTNNNGNLMTISLGNFANGIYLMEVQTEKGRVIKRLAKQ